MQRAGQITSTLALVGAMALITACAGNSDFTDAAIGQDRAALWEDGLQAASSGEALIEQGERLLVDGRRQIREGEAMIADGKQQTLAAKKAYQAVAAASETEGPGTTKRKLERIDRDWEEAAGLIERGRQMVERGNANIEKGQAEIKEGQALMAQGGEKMRRSHLKSGQ